MGKLGRDFYRKKMRKLLSATKDEEFFQLVWAVNALQSGREKVAANWLEFPPAAAGPSIAASNAIHKWELETVVNQRFLYPKWELQEGKNRFLNSRMFGAASTVINCLRSLENAESGVRLQRVDVFSELHRIGYRQFPWQRGFLNLPQFYRSAFIYGQGKCRDHFENSYGLKFVDFSLVGFCFFAAYQNEPALRSNYSLASIGIDEKVLATALKLLSIDYEDARAGFAEMCLPALGVANQPSFIRKFPIVRFEGNAGELRAPLPDLIALRITTGVYYDIVSGGQSLLNEASDRFELYSQEFIQAELPKLSVERSEKYQFAGTNYETTDVLIRSEGTVVAAVECKATKLTFLAQFGDSPLSEATRVFDEVAKAVFQLWRYFSHARRGAFSSAVSPDAYGLVLMLDPWMPMSDLYGEVIRRAGVLADKDRGIISTDRKSVVICSIEDLESTLSVATEETFLEALSAASEQKYENWMLSIVHEKVASNKIEPKRFPFKLDDVLPWWEVTAELREAARRKRANAVSPHP